MSDDNEIRNVFIFVVLILVFFLGLLVIANLVSLKNSASKNSAPKSNHVVMVPNDSNLIIECQTNSSFKVTYITNK